MADDDSYSSSNDTKTPDKGRWKDSKGASALRGAAAGSQAGSAALSRDAASDASRIGPVTFGYKRGGKVRKTGPAIVHRGERVIPAGKRKKVERLMKRNKMRMKARS